MRFEFQAGGGRWEKPLASGFIVAVIFLSSLRCDFARACLASGVAAVAG